MSDQITAMETATKVVKEITFPDGEVEKYTRADLLTRRKLNPEETQYVVEYLRKEVAKARASLSSANEELRSKTTSSQNKSEDLQDSSLLTLEFDSRASHHKKFLQKVPETMKRMGNGTFGRCKECGEYLPVGRQLCCPLSSSCTDCK